MFVDYWDGRGHVTWATNHTPGNLSTLRGPTYITGEASHEDEVLSVPMLR